MAWNEPGGGRDNDPWGGGNNNQGPPDLDEALKKLQDRLNSLFGGGKNGGNSGNNGGGLLALLGLAERRRFPVLESGWLLGSFWRPLES